MTREMCWIAASQSQDEKILHLRTQPYQPWQPYFALPMYAVPDSLVPGGSKGWTTYQKLLKEGWKLVPTGVAEAQATMAQQKIA